MKREFLKNLKIGDQELPKEIIDAIMEENGRDIEAAKKPYADYESINEQLQTAKKSLEAFEKVDVDQLRGEITKLTEDLANKDKEWQQKLDDMAFDGKVKDSITAFKGKNTKAIAALLDMDALRASKNQDADLKAAMEALQKENGYLFGDDSAPPVYAAGTGSQSVTGKYTPEIAAIRSASGLKNE